jgi:hypothetical protein
VINFDEELLKNISIFQSYVKTLNSNTVENRFKDKNFYDRNQTVVQTKMKIVRKNHI